MGYIDLIPDVFRLTMPDLATGKSYHTQKFNVGNKQCIGVTIKASQALSVAVAYGIATDTAAAAGVDIAASLPYKTSATSFASNTSTEGGTYHEIAVPPHARQAQLVISNASGSPVSGAVIDAALRVVAYPAASGSGSSDFASITGWPGSSSQFVHADGSYSPLSASDNLWAVPTTTRSSNAFSGDLAVAPTLATGLVITWRVPSAPSGASTYNLNSLGAKDIYIRNAAAGAADLVANRDLTMRYDGTRWQIIAMGTIAINDLPALVRLEAVISSGQSTINGYQTLNFDAASVNTGPGWSYSSGVFTCLIAGTYDFSLALFTNNAANASLFAKLNNTTLIASTQATNLYNAPHLNDSYTFGAGDTVRFQVQCGTGSISIDVSIASYRELRITRKPTA